MTSENIPAFVEEDHMPPPNELKFRWCLLIEMNYRIGRRQILEAIREEKGRAGGRVCRQEKGHGRAVASIVGAGDAPEAKLRRIYDRV
jgi:hypothetical protein